MKEKKKKNEKLEGKWELPLAFNVYNTFMSDKSSFEDSQKKGAKLAKKCQVPERRLKIYQLQSWAKFARWNEFPKFEKTNKRNQTKNKHIFLNMSPKQKGA